MITKNYNYRGWVIEITARYSDNGYLYKGSTYINGMCYDDTITNKISESSTLRECKMVIDKYIENDNFTNLAEENEHLKKKLEIATNALKALNYQENCDRLIVESALELLSENNS